MTVRWDAVVASEHRRSEPARPAARPTPCAGAPVSVHLWLFGSLAGALPERPLELRFPLPFSIADVIAELGRRCGDEFASRVTAPDGSLLRHCRVFVDGEAVEDPRAPVRAHDPVAHIEMILLTAAEGG
ncbi:MAG: MoaD/ThiS family protein [Burkholderiales bacterium]